MSDGERKSSTWWTVRITCVDHALVAQRERGVGRDAVLRVDDVEAAVAQQRAQAVAVGRDHRGDASRRSRRRAASWRTTVAGTARRAEERGAGRADREQLDLVAAGGERLGDLDRVHDPAARAHGVREHRDAQAPALMPPHRPHGQPGRGGVRRARRSRPRLAAPRSGGARPAGPRPCRTRARSPAPASATRRSAAASSPAGSGCEPWPRTTSSSTQPSASSLGRLARASRARTSRSTIGCGRPCGVLLLAEVEDRVAAVAVVVPARVAADRAERGLEDRHRLVGERAAREQAEQRARPASRRASTARSSAATSGAVPRRRPRTPPASSVGGSRTARRRRPSRRTRRPTRLPGGSRRRPAPRRPRGDGRLGDQQERLGRVVARRAVRIASRNMIPPTSADRSRPPTPTICDTPTAGARRAGTPPPARRSRPRRRCRRGRSGTTLAKPEPDAAEHRRAAPRAHDEQAELAAAALELDLVGDGDVVGEEEDVQARGQRAVRLEGGVLAGDRDRARRSRRRGRRRPTPSERGGRRGAGPVRAGAARAAGGEHPLGLGQRVARRSLVAVDRDHDVARRRVRPRAEVRERLEVRGRAHRHLARAIPSRPRSARAMPISRTLST